MGNQSTILRVNIFFLISSVILIFFGGVLQSFNLVLGILATEWIILLGLAFIYSKAFHIDFSIYRFKKISRRDALLTIIMTLLLYPIVVFFNLIATLGLRLFFEFEPLDMPIPETGIELVILFFVIAVSAGVCEEIFFRGLILNEFKRYGDKAAIIITAILFGIFHYNYQNFIGPVILGLFFGYIVLRTGSIWAGIIGHITNNAFALVIGFALLKLQENFAPDTTNEVVTQAAITYDLIAGAILFGVLTLINLFLIYRLLNYMSDVNNMESETKAEQEQTIKVKSELKLFYPILVTIIGYLYFAFSNLSIK